MKIINSKNPIELIKNKEFIMDGSLNPFAMTGEPKFLRFLGKTTISVSDTDEFIVAIGRAKIQCSLNIPFVEVTHHHRYLWGLIKYSKTVKEYKYEETQDLFEKRNVYFNMVFGKRPVLIYDYPFYVKVNDDTVEVIKPSEFAKLRNTLASHVNKETKKLIKNAK